MKYYDRFQDAISYTIYYVDLIKFFTIIQTMFYDNVYNIIYYPFIIEMFAETHQ